MSRWFEDSDAHTPEPDVKAALDALMQKAKDEPYKEPKRIEIGTLCYPWYYPDLDKMAIQKAIMCEVERQLVEYHKSIARP